MEKFNLNQRLHLKTLLQEFDLKDFLENAIEIMHDLSNKYDTPQSLRSYYNEAEELQRFLNDLE